MPIGRILFLAFLLIPIAEIYVLIQVGSVIGPLPTIALIIFTAVLGSVLIRAQGLATLARVRDSMGRGEVPAVELMEGMCLLVAGALLLTPGFVTDSFGFALLVPPLRRAMIFALLQRGVLRTMGGVGGSVGSTQNAAENEGIWSDAASRQRAAPGRPFGGRTADDRSNAGPDHGPRRGHIIDGEFEHKDPQ